jgi:hypothetical protein
VWGKSGGRGCRQDRGPEGTARVEPRARAGPRGSSREPARAAGPRCRPALPARAGPAASLRRPGASESAGDSDSDPRPLDARAAGSRSSGSVAGPASAVRPWLTRTRRFDVTVDPSSAGPRQAGPRDSRWAPWARHSLETSV